MITIDELRGQKVAVVGLGKSGISTLASLQASGAIVFAWDDNQAGRDAVSSLLKLPHQLILPENMPWSEIKLLVLAPGIPLTHPTPHPVVVLAKKHGCKIICDVELLYRAHSHARFVGITGTNGKSTTTTLIHHILTFAGVTNEVGGNLGFPALSLKPMHEKDIYVVELSSYQLDLLDTAHMHISVWLNITPDHLDRHGGLDGYVKAKKRIFKHQNVNDTAVIGIDDTYSQSVFNELQAEAKLGKIIPVSCQKPVENGVAVIDGIIIDQRKGTSKRHTLGYLP
jgi:UDP-N-acetylmuramoylalanine--D-glutamate ligase